MNRGQRKFAASSLFAVFTTGVVASNVAGAMQVQHLQINILNDVQNIAGLTREQIAWLLQNEKIGEYAKKALVASLTNDQIARLADDQIVRLLKRKDVTDGTKAMLVEKLDDNKIAALLKKDGKEFAEDAKKELVANLDNKQTDVLLKNVEVVAKLTNGIIAVLLNNEKVTDNTKAALAANLTGEKAIALFQNQVAVAKLTSEGIVILLLEKKILGATKALLISCLNKQQIAAAVDFLLENNDLLAAVLTSKVVAERYKVALVEKLDNGKIEGLLNDSNFVAKAALAANLTNERANRLYLSGELINKEARNLIYNRIGNWAKFKGAYIYHKGVAIPVTMLAIAVILGIVLSLTLRKGDAKKPEPEPQPEPQPTTESDSILKEGAKAVGATIGGGALAGGLAEGASVLLDKGKNGKNNKKTENTGESYMCLDGNKPAEESNSDEFETELPKASEESTEADSVNSEMNDEEVEEVSTADENNENINENEDANSTVNEANEDVGEKNETKIFNDESNVSDAETVDGEDENSSNVQSE